MINYCEEILYTQTRTLPVSTFNAVHIRQNDVILLLLTALMKPTKRESFFSQDIFKHSFCLHFVVCCLRRRESQVSPFCLCVHELDLVISHRPRRLWALKAVIHTLDVRSYATSCVSNGKGESFFIRVFAWRMNTKQPHFVRNKNIKVIWGLY